MSDAAAAPPAAAEPMDIGDDDENPSSVVTETATSPSEDASTMDAEEEPTSTLWCSGDAPNSPQQHNFEGMWKLYTDAVSRSQRPIYEHVAPGGMAIYLYFVEQATPAGPCPRWVIGPEPAGDGMNGWAFSDSSAARPEEIFEPWRAWIKEANAWEEARLAFSAKGGNALARDTDYDASDDDTMATPGEGGTPGGGGKKKKGKAGKKKAGGAKGGGKKKSAADGKGSGSKAAAKAGKAK